MILTSESLVSVPLVSGESRGACPSGRTQCGRGRRGTESLAPTRLLSSVGAASPQTERPNAARITRRTSRQYVIASLASALVAVIPG